MSTRSRPEISSPSTVNSGAVNRTIQLSEKSRAIRLSIASASPRARARGCWALGSRLERIEMKTMLSMPRTISSTVRVAKAIQACGSVIQSMAQAGKGRGENCMGRNIGSGHLPSAGGPGREQQGRGAPAQCEQNPGGGEGHAERDRLGRGEVGLPASQSLPHAPFTSPPTEVPSKGLLKGGFEGLIRPPESAEPLSSFHPDDVGEEPVADWMYRQECVGAVSPAEFPGVGECEIARQ